MLSAIAAAEIGDDQWGEEPTINKLQSRLATLLGKEAALWLPTGTMANQVALRVLSLIDGAHCSPGLEEGVETFCLMEAVRQAVERGQSIDVRTLLADASL